MKNLFLILIILFTFSCGQSETTTVSGKIVKVIPGLTAVDVYGNFTNKGFKLDKLLGADYFEWKLEKSNIDYNQSVVAIGSGPTNIVSIKAVNMDFKKDSVRASSFLGYVASLPYEGSKPQYAKDWVINNIGKNTSRVIGNIRFKLANNEKTNILLIERVD